ncbi:MAG: hypothetical protein HY903_23170 [Deltaproteobacteria bacterium]|nr:hypothetical protein [Deltaproteobacteria bacterium]
MQRRHRLAVALVIGCCLVGAGTDCSRHGAACGGNDDCASGEACISGACSVLCTADAECPAGQRCDVDHCVLSDQPNDAPIIVTVNGSGSIGQSADHAPRHLRDRLVIAGFNLGAATVELAAEGRAGIELALCAPATDTELQASLPPDTAAGRYTLVVKNQAGSCSAGLTLLQGEPGTLDASAALVVENINDALAADPSLRLRGMLPTGKPVTLLTVLGSATQLGGRSVVVNDAEQIRAGENDAAGLFLILLDLDTHQVVDRSAGAGLWSRGAFATDGAAHLTDVLAWANDLGNGLADYAVILASAGNVTALSRDPALFAALKKIGASPRFADLQADEAYVLVGQKEVGEGMGLEIVAGAGRNGVATLGATVVGPAVLGIGATRSTAWLQIDRGSAIGDTLARFCTADGAHCARLAFADDNADVYGTWTAGGSTDTCNAVTGTDYACAAEEAKTCVDVSDTPDTYGGWTTAGTFTADSCNSNKLATFTCAAGAAIASCVDVYNCGTTDSYGSCAYGQRTVTCAGNRKRDITCNNRMIVLESDRWQQ